MPSHRWLRSVVALSVGGLAAFLVAPRLTGIFAGDAEAHAAPRVPSGSDLHRSLTDLALALEDGSVDLERVTSATELVLQGIRGTTRDGQREIPVGFEGTTAGVLKVPDVRPDGRRDFSFEFELAPPPRYGQDGGTTDLTITYATYGDQVSFVSALTHTHVHLRESTLPKVSEAPMVVGGCFRVNEGRTQWNSFVLEMEMPADGIPVWRDRIGTLEQRADQPLSTDGIAVCVAALLAL